MRKPFLPLIAVVVALLAAAAPACSPGGTGGGSVASPPSSPPLYPPLRPDGVTAVPVVFLDAETSFLRGAVAYQLGSYHEAAESFFHVAEALSPPPERSFAGAFAANRALAYHNAAVAWTMAGEFTLARARLTKAADTDVDCHDVLEGLLAILPEEPLLVPDGGAPSSEDAAPAPTNSAG